MKLKTSKTAKKRVLVNRGGVFRRPAAISHLRTHKSDREKRKEAVSKSDLKKLKRLVPKI